jgi:hypothetical protein
MLRVGLRRFPSEVKIVDPELTTDRTACRKPPNMEYHELAVRAGGKFATDRLPESRVLQLVGIVINDLAVHILNREMGAAGALQFSVFVKGGKLIGSLGLHRNELVDTSVGDSGAIKSNQKGPTTSMIIARISYQRDPGLFLILPIKTAIEDIETEGAIHDQIGSRGQV